MAAGRADFCDVFCEKDVFELEDSERLLLAARDLGFRLKLHADEIVPLGGTALAAKLEATSADHLLKSSDEDLIAMRDAGTVATLLPCTAFSLKEDYARGRFMIDNGLAVALASDLNPGSCYTQSVPLIISLATIYMGLSIEETITALTLNGAAAIDRANSIGSPEAGKQADLIASALKSQYYSEDRVYDYIQVVENGKQAVAKKGMNELKVYCHAMQIYLAK